MRIIFFGTGNFGVPTIKKLLKSDHEILAAVTQPDSKKGRGYNVLPTPVKAYLEKAAPGMEILQPEDSRDEEFIKIISEYIADIFIVVDYGQKLSNKLLNLPDRSCINLHPSLLPEYRGASPISNAILDGESITGITVFKMAEKMDAGDIILKEEINILPDENAADLAVRLSVKGAELVLKVLGLLSEDRAIFLPQNEKEATYSHKLKKGDGEIDWHSSAFKIFNQIRAFQPWPGAYTYLNGKILKVIKAEIMDQDASNVMPGKILDDTDLIVATGKGCLKILTLQLEGKKIMESKAFLRGKTLSGNIFLG